MKNFIIVIFGVSILYPFMLWSFYFSDFLLKKYANSKSGASDKKKQENRSYDNDPKRNRCLSC